MFDFRAVSDGGYIVYSFFKNSSIFINDIVVKNTPNCQFFPLFINGYQANIIIQHMIVSLDYHLIKTAYFVLDKSNLTLCNIYFE